MVRPMTPSSKRAAAARTPTWSPGSKLYSLSRIPHQLPAQCGGYDLGASHVETRNRLLHEIGYVDGTQLCDRDLTTAEAKVEKRNNRPVIYDRLTRQRPGDANAAKHMLFNR